MGKRGDRKRLMHRMRRTARRIPLGATNLPPWLKSHFPTIYARHVAYRMINGNHKEETRIQPGAYMDMYGRDFVVTKEMSDNDMFAKGIKRIA